MVDASAFITDNEVREAEAVSRPLSIRQRRVGAGRNPRRFTRLGGARGRSANRPAFADVEKKEIIRQTIQRLALFLKNKAWE